MGEDSWPSLQQATQEERDRADGEGHSEEAPAEERDSRLGEGTNGKGHERFGLWSRSEAGK